MVVGIVACGADLLHDHLLLAGQFILVEGRILQDIGQDIGRQHHVILEHAGKIAGMLDGGRRVEISPDILDGLGNLKGRPGTGTLERHVFEQVRDAMLGLALGPCTGLHPHAQRGALQMRHVIGEHHHAVLKGRRSYAHTGPPEPSAETTAALFVSFRRGYGPL